MKSKLYPFIVVLATVLCSCQKELSFEANETAPPQSIETKYLTLGTWDESGRPNYLQPRDVVSNGLTSFIQNTLPERSDLRNASPALLNSNAEIVIKQSSDVYVTFVSRGAGLTNTVAFYTYPTNKPPTKSTDIRTITYIFPNAGNGSTLDVGDKVKIGRFSAGISIGFVLIPAGWNSTNKAIENNGVHFYSTDILNPEADISLKKHAVPLEYAAENKVLIGFEDEDRTQRDCDHDFNDIMFFTTVTP
jgi:hypothetical protein